MLPYPSTVPLDRSSRRFSQSHIPQPVYLGLDVVVSPERDESQYSISVHDGSYTTDYYYGRLCDHPKGMARSDCIRNALSKLGDVVQMYALAQDYKVQLVACSYWVADQVIKDEERPERSSMSAFWRNLDALPFNVETHGETSDERASAAVRKSVMWLTPGNPGNLPRVSVGFRHEVEVDFKYQIHMVDLIDYKELVCDETWRVLQEMVHAFKERKLRVSFLSSTPQGGGVALMRHALLRFLHLNGVDVHWHVARPKPEIFDITKRKFHNVMQGVAPEGVCLSEQDEQAFIDWSEENVNRFWLDDKGPVKNSDVIVIDDPQVTGIIPLIRKHAPETKIIFRSHIEMRADLIRQHPNGPQAKTWDFLWNFIKDADLFIAHPVENFIPDQVPRHNVVLMPACTDPLDGLNKHLPKWCAQYYQRVFNRVCIDQGAQEVDWERPYIVQVSRFDPSKGIPDCLEAYRRLRLKLAEEEDFDPERTPQLVICGHGSIDDPEGTVVYEETHAQLADPNFAQFAKDIIIARLPPSDQLLNVILRCARVAMQLSYREGFEVKVTEALLKGLPVVAYEAGGIPLQIQRDKNGFLIPVGEIDTVVQKLYQLIVDDKLHAKMCQAARTGITEEYFTVWNAMNWLHLWIELTNKRGSNSEGLNGELDTLDHNSGIGNSKKACELWKAKYNYNPIT